MVASAPRARAKLSGAVCKVVAFTIVLLLQMSTAARASTPAGIDPYEEFGKRIQAAQAVAPMSDNAFGDRISLYDGATGFDVTDFSVPGNNALPVSLGRRFQVQSWPKGLDPGNLGGFGEWDLDVPYLEAEVTTQNGWTLSGGSSARCSDTTDLLNTRVPGPAGLIVAPINVIGNGYQLHVPGMGDQQLLVNDQSKAPAAASAGTYKWVTVDHWKVSCLSTTANGYPGQAFAAVSPQGVTYTFNWAVVHAAPSVSVLSTANRLGTTKYYAGRERVFMLITKVQDRFGNTVTYTYDGSNHLKQIVAGDGRSITLTWSGNNIVSASSALGTWNYQYGTDAKGDSTLTKVIRPDGSEWTYAITAGSLATTKNPYCSQCSGDDPPPPPQHCQLTPYPDLGTFGFSVTAPSGATAEYSFQYQRHFRAGIPRSCPDGNPDHLYPAVYDFFDAFTIVSKQITGPGLPPGMIWTYDTGGTYDDISGAAPGYFYATVPYDYSALVYLPSGSCPATSPGYNSSVTGPTSRIYYAYGKTYACDAGRLYGTQVEDLSGNVLKTTTNTYVSESAAPNEPFPSVVGTDQLGNFVHPIANRLRPVTETVINQGGATFTTAVNSFDDFARATSETASSSLGYSKTDTTTYADDTSRWVLGMVTQSATNGIVASQTSYDSLDRPVNEYKFGKLESTKAWNADGTLASITDGDGHTTTLSSWYRGLPRTVTYADGTHESATVNDAGWITSLTDEDGFATNYAYDPMGRLSQISYPTGDDVAWNPMVLSFAPVAGSEYGIPAGHWKQTVHTGNDYTVTYFDAFWRPLVSEHYDAGNRSATLSQVVTRYDAAGRKVFTSYPTRAATSYTQALPGDHTSHDALDRVTQVSQDSELGALPTTTAYLPGLQTQVTDPRGYSTTTRYLAYGEPTTKWPMSISAPQGVLTTIQRDVFGKPLSITRTGTALGSPSLTRYYVYDGYQQLCKRIEPESGTTAFGYDNAGNLSWSASGLNLPDTGNCDTSTAQSSGRVATRTYDKRNRLLTIVYPDGSSNASFGYYADGALQTQTISNGGNPVTTDYYYDERRLLTSETLAISSTSPFTLTYGHDSNGHLASTTYPDGRTIGFAPNALGQPTAAGTYAGGATYYPNGAIASFTYGNGLVHTMTENERGLVDRSTDSYHGAAVHDDGYNYDGDSNVAAVTDYLPGNVGNRDMTYDGLDRLTEADSPMFGSGSADKALYSYDVLDNLLSASVGNYTNQAYSYNADGQLVGLVEPGTVYNLHTYTYDVRRTGQLGEQRRGGLPVRHGEPPAQCAGCRKLSLRRRRASRAEE
jgi:YD repeat-containing protein